MRVRSTSATSAVASFIVAASGCAPPIPPSPAVTTSLPASESPKCCLRHRGEALVRSLEDSLRADVDPRAGRHLAVHRQAEGVEAAELVPGGPVRDEVGVGDEHARRVLVRAEDAHRLARLHEQRLVVLQPLQRGDDGVVALPVARRLADAAVHDQLLRPLGHFRIEVVHQHPQRRFLLPALAGDLGAARRADRSGLGMVVVMRGFYAMKDRKARARSHCPSRPSVSGRASRARFHESVRAADRHDPLRAVDRRAREHRHQVALPQVSGSRWFASADLSGDGARRQADRLLPQQGQGGHHLLRRPSWRSTAAKCPARWRS